MDNSTDLLHQPFPIRWPDFRAECARRGIASEFQLDWLIRFRDSNGLTAVGGIIAKRPNPRSTRPILFAVPTKFLAWLATSDEGQARGARS